MGWGTHAQGQGGGETPPAPNPRRPENRPGDAVPPPPAPPQAEEGSPKQAKIQRVRPGLQVEYRFDEATGTEVRDHSGQQPPLHLAIENTSAVRWVSGGLSLHSPTILTTPGPALRLTEALRRSGELSVEAWIRPTQRSQDGMARLIGISKGLLARNFTLGHGIEPGVPSASFGMRLRSTDTDLNGTPVLRTEPGVVTTEEQHLVYTRTRDGQVRLYLDGQVVAERQDAGDFGNWDSSYHLAIANEIGGGRPWLGEMYLLAVYNRPLSAEEVQQNRKAGSGATVRGHLSVAPVPDTSIIAIQGEGVVHADRNWILKNIGSEGLEWSLTETSDWLQVEPQRGHLGPGSEASLALRLDIDHIETLELGTYRAQLQFANTTSKLGSCDRWVNLQVLPPGSSAGPGSKPGPHNTGPSNPTILETIGPLTVTKDGTVIENVRIEGMLVVRADNVTIRNFVIDGRGSRYGIRCSYGHKNLLVEDGEIFNVSSACIYGGGFTARRLNLHESGGDGLKTRGNTVVESCWIHHLGKAPGAHADCNQTRSGQSFVFRGNFFDIPIDIRAPYKSNACLIIQTGLGPIDDVLIENNWLTGGNFTVYVTDKGNGYGPPTNVRILNNRFGREYRYGVLQMFGYVHVEGNRWDDTDELMGINNR